MFLATPVACEIPAPSKLDMVIEDLELVFARGKLFWVRRTVSPLEGTRPRQLKTP